MGNTLTAAQHTGRCYVRGVAERRRLPVLSSPPPEPGGASSDDDAEPRPPWHWVGFGVVAIFAAWLPLAYLGASASSRVMNARFGADASKDQIEVALAAMTAAERAKLMTTVALPSIFGLAVAAFGGGFVVGRFGDKTGVREAAISGAITGALATALAWSGPTLSTLVAAFVTIAVATGFAALGGKTGTRRREGTRARASSA